MQTIADVGEKRLISEFIKPFFNAANSPEGVGDDCAILMAAERTAVLLSTDRVPADLIAFRLGILDFTGLGRYLATLNVSDIAACGGTPKALLLNFGLPATLLYDDLVGLCRGVQDVSSRFGCPVLGGDLSSAGELSLSATVVGFATPGKVLTRRGARPGDTVFVSRPIGRTPAAFAYHLRCQPNLLNDDQVQELNAQFLSLDPMVRLGQQLAELECCSSCMDNTDGLGQSFVELADSSGAAFFIDVDRLTLDSPVSKIAGLLGLDPVELAFSAGADFSLVGTLKGGWSQRDVESTLGIRVTVVGEVRDGNGLWFYDEQGKRRIQFSGWNYFHSAR